MVLRNHSATKAARHDIAHIRRHSYSGYGRLIGSKYRCGRIYPPIVAFLLWWRYDLTPRTFIRNRASLNGPPKRRNYDEFQEGSDAVRCYPGLLCRIVGSGTISVNRRRRPNLSADPVLQALCPPVLSVSILGIHAGACGSAPGLRSLTAGLLSATGTGASDAILRLSTSISDTAVHVSVANTKYAADTDPSTTTAGVADTATSNNTATASYAPTDTTAARVDSRSARSIHRHRVLVGRLRFGERTEATAGDASSSPKLSSTFISKTKSRKCQRTKAGWRLRFGVCLLKATTRMHKIRSSRSLFCLCGNLTNRLSASRRTCPTNEPRWSHQRQTASHDIAHIKVHYAHG